MKKKDYNGFKITISENENDNCYFITRKASTSLFLKISAYFKFNKRNKKLRHELFVLRVSNIFDDKGHELFQLGDAMITNPNDSINQYSHKQDGKFIVFNYWSKAYSQTYSTIITTDSKATLNDEYEDFFGQFYKTDKRSVKILKDFVDTNKYLVNCANNPYPGGTYPLGYSINYSDSLTFYLPIKYTKLFFDQLKLLSKKGHFDTKISQVLSSKKPTKRP